MIDNKLTKNSTFIIAELSANHIQKKELALKTIEAISKTGADAVKLQTYTADTITLDSRKEYFQIKQGTIWDGRTLYDLYKEAFTPWEWHEELMAFANQLGLICFSSPFDFSAVDFLEKLHVPMYKIASFEITDIPLIEYTASKKKPIIISTGIATLADIEEAVNACRRVGNDDITLLKCTSSYPAPVEEANLLTIPNLRDTFHVNVGLSDHTMGGSIAVAAVALGAKVLEKHIILDRKMGGPDSDFSMEPVEFTKMVNSIRNVEKALGRVTYELSPKVQKTREFSRSLFVVKDMKAGETFSAENIRSVRPGYGLHPKHYFEILGKTASVDIERGEPLAWYMIGR